MIITVYKQISSDTEGGGDTQPLEEFNIPQIDSLSIVPVRDNVGTNLTAKYLAELVDRAELVPTLSDDERYARDVDAWKDGRPVSAAMDIPHDVGFQLVVSSILRKYENFPGLLFQIS